MIRTRYFVAWVGAAVIIVIAVLLLSGCEREPFGPPSPAPCVSAS